MAHFRATIQGSRGEASRLGTKQSGIFADVNGWDAGVRVKGIASRDAAADDYFWIASSGGSNGRIGYELGVVRASSGKFHPSPLVRAEVEKDLVERLAEEIANGGASGMREFTKRVHNAADARIAEMRGTSNT